jgi:hypothetical protein
MKRRNRDDHPLLYTVEEATLLLRRCPVRAWFWWFAGTAPFVCCSIHFWSDMSRAADAQSHLVESALYLALAYGFMKIAQSVFGDALLRSLRGDEDPVPLPLRGKLRLITSQLVIHCATPWVLGLASVAVIPFGWVYAFFHNANILALSVFRQGGRTRDLYKQALAQCYYRPRQNHGVISLLLIFSFLVWLNLLAGAAMFFILMKSFTGTENVFTRNPMLFMSSGFIAATMAVAYMVAGPFVKACYAVRCFYGLSRKNGEDIAVRFRAASATTFAAVLLACALWVTSLHAETSLPLQGSPPVASKGIDPTALDKNIRDVMQEDIFQWRMPRDEAHLKNKEAGWLDSFMRDMVDWMKSVIRDIEDFFERMLKDRIKEMLRKLWGDDHGSHGSVPSTPWADTVQMVLYVLLAVLTAVLVVLLYRQWRKRTPKPKVAATAAPEIDLKSDEVVATQLAENEWLKLAQEKMDAGEYRLALRALFLATLAHLGEQRMIMIARFKSNGDYLRELGFRARDRESLRGSFREQTQTFDWAWYGWHDVTRELLERFRENHQRIVSDGAS